MKTYVVPIVSVVAAIALLMASWTPVLANGGGASDEPPAAPGGEQPAGESAPPSASDEPPAAPGGEQPAGGSAPPSVSDEPPATPEGEQPPVPDGGPPSDDGAAAEDDASLVIEKSGSHYALSVPSNLSEGIVIDPAGDEPAIRMTKLGISDEDDSLIGAVAVSNEFAIYEEHNSAVLAFEDGGYALLEVIENANSAGALQYHIDLGDGQSISSDGVGGYQVVNEDGENVVALGAPWAVDAAGTDVPTRYQLDENGNLTLEVDHLGGTNYVYPIVADPCWRFWSRGCKKKVAEAAAWGFFSGRAGVALGMAIAGSTAGLGTKVGLTVAVSTVVLSTALGAFRCMMRCDPDP